MFINFFQIAINIPNTHDNKTSDESCFVQKREKNVISYSSLSQSMNSKFDFTMAYVIKHVTRRVKKDMLSANTVLRYRPVKFVKYKENNRNKYAS